MMMHGQTKIKDFCRFLQLTQATAESHLQTETNRRTSEASSGLYKNTSKEGIYRKFFGLQNCRWYPYVQYHIASCVFISVFLPLVWPVSTLWY
jgi:hypothetical protein